ncbi:MAG: phosphodiesterase [Sulfitobacter sp.]
MLKAIWMSDLHFVCEGMVSGHDPRLRLNAAVNHINRHHDDASFCVISGDLVNHGTKADYASLRDHLDTLAIPFLPMAGNHDDRAMLRTHLPLPTSCMTDFIQYSISTPNGLVVCLDTQKSGSDAGEFCAKRLAWLKSVLDKAKDIPVYLFMHHPPMPLGLPMQDSDRMQNGDVFLDLVSHYACVKYMFIGHVHRPISGLMRGIAFSTMRSVLYQAPAPLPEWNWDSFKPSEEAPNMGILTLSDGAVTLQYDQFCSFDVGTSS